MKKTIKATLILLAICQFSFGQSIILVNGEAVKAKINHEEIVEIVDNKIKNYMNDFEQSKKDYFKKEEDIEIKKPEVKKKTLD